MRNAGGWSPPPIPTWAPKYQKNVSFFVPPFTGVFKRILEKVEGGPRVRGFHQLFRHGLIQRRAGLPFFAIDCRAFMPTKTVSFS